jgi:predicted enzyme related to lactoylglutathione lyase
VSEPPGRFCWLDLAAPDIEAAERFYGELFGWTHEPAGPPEVSGGYSFFLHQGRPACGYGPPGPGEPPSWRPHVHASDADETARLVREGGGRVLLEPMDIPQSGRITVFTDPTGAVCCAWQPGGFAGTDPGGPGTFVWTELQTRDSRAAAEFYALVFGWSVQELPAYAMFSLDGRPLAGLMQMDENWAPEIPANWLVYFGSEDAAATERRALELGGSSHVPARTVSAGGPASYTFTVLSDPNGAVFAVRSIA